MYQDQFVFSQIMKHLPWTTFDRCVQHYQGNRKVRSFRCSQQFRSMAIAQLTQRTSLREIEICLRAHAEKLYHLGFPNGISKSTLAKANEQRNWRIHADFAQRLIASARRLHTHDDFQMDLDQTVALTGVKTAQHYPDQLRRTKNHDRSRDKTLVFLTNNTNLPALTIAELYKNRWHVELFFKWMKQHLRIKKFYGRTENAVKTQIWVAISVYVLIAIIRKRMDLDVSLYKILQILDTTLFEKIHLYQLLTDFDYTTHFVDQPKQLNLFDI